MRAKLLISTALVATAFCVNTAKAEQMVISGDASGPIEPVQKLSNFSDTINSPRPNVSIKTDTEATLKKLYNGSYQDDYILFADSVTVEKGATLNLDQTSISAFKEQNGVQTLNIQGALNLDNSYIEAGTDYGSEEQQKGEFSAEFDGATVTADKDSMIGATRDITITNNSTFDLIDTDLDAYNNLSITNSTVTSKGTGTNYYPEYYNEDHPYSIYDEDGPGVDEYEAYGLSAQNINVSDSTLNLQSVYLGTEDGNIELSGENNNITLDHATIKVGLWQENEESEGSIKISGGTTTLNNKSEIKNHAGNLMINGGTLNIKGESEVYANTTTVSGENTHINIDGSSFGGDDNLYINGGTIEVKNGAMDADEEIVISGGKLSIDNSGLSHNIDEEDRMPAGTHMAGGNVGLVSNDLSIEGGETTLITSARGINSVQMTDGILTLNTTRNEYASTLWSAGDITLSGGTINLNSTATEDGSNITTFLSTDEEGYTPGNIYLSGAEINVHGEGHMLGTSGDIVMNGGSINIDEASALEARNVMTEDGHVDEKSLATIQFNDGEINLKGDLAANIVGNNKGTINFKSSDGVVDGDVEKVNVTFESNHSLSKAMTGSVDANKLTIKDGKVHFDDDKFKANTLNITGGETELDNDFYVSTLQNPNGGDITIEGGTVNLNGYSLNAMSGGINVSGGTINMENKGDDPDNTLWAAKDITIKGGVINMGDDASIDTFYDWKNVDKPEQAGNIYIQGGQINVTGQSAGISSEGKIEVSDKGVIDIADGATLNSYSSFSVEDDEMEEKDKATIENNGTINVSGKLAANVSGEGTLNFNFVNAVVDGDVENVNVTFNADNTLSKALTGGISDLAALNIAKGTLVFDKKVSVDSLNVDSVLDAGLNKVEIDGDANFAKTSTLKVEIAEDDNGSFKANNINVEDGAKLAFNITKKMEIGDEIKDVALLDGNLDGVFKNQLPNSRYTITSEDNKVFNITYDASASDVVIDAGGSTNNAATAEAWDSMVNQESASDQAKAVASVLVDLSQNATTPEGKKAYVDALTALAPETAPAVQQVATETANQIFGAVGTRLSGGSIASTKQGMSSGDNPFTKIAVWVQGLFNKSKLDKTKKAKGFDSKTYGTAMGIEGKLSQEVKLGVGYAYSKTDIDGFKRDTDVKTHTAIVYGEYKPNNWFVNGIATYGWSDYDEKKNVGGVSVKADYDVEALSMQAMTGYDMNINGFGLTPETGLRYVHIKNKSYKNSVDERIKSSDSDIITGVVGARLNKAYAYNHMILKPELKAAMTYDLANDDTKSVVTLVNGSSYAVSGKALNRFGVELGVGLTMEVNDNVELSLGYEGKFREDYQDHTGLINAKYKF